MKIYEYIYEKFRRNPVMVSIFLLSFVAVPTLSSIIYFSQKKELELCHSAKAKADSTLLKYVELSSYNKGILDAIKITDSIRYEK